jgi:hypothetical protein
MLATTGSSLGKHKSQLPATKEAPNPTIRIVAFVILKLCRLEMAWVLEPGDLEHPQHLALRQVEHFVGQSVEDCEDLT